MEDRYADKILPTSHIQPTIHNRFPTEKISLVDHSIEKIESCIVYPESVDLNAKTTIEFILHEASLYYLDLSSLQLEVTLSLHQPNGNAPAAGHAVYLGNNLLSSLFPIRKCFINNVCVETQYSGNHIGRINQLLHTNNQIVSNRGESRGLFPLEPEKLKSPIDEATCNNNAVRQAFSKKAKIHLKGYLDLDICGINMWLLDLCTFRLILEAASDNLIINAKDNATAYKYKIHSMKLHFDRVKPTVSGLINTTKLLQKNPIEYLLKQHIVHSELLPEGQSSLTINRPFNNQIPHLLYIFMNKQLAYTGVYNEDPLYHQTNGLINYRVMIDGKLLIDQDVDTDNNGLAGYVNSLKAHNNSENFVPYNMYTKGCFLLIVKTNHTQNGEISYTKKGNLTLHLKFGANVASNQSVYIIGQCHSTFEINADRNVVTNYSF